MTFDTAFQDDAFQNDAYQIAPLYPPVTGSGYKPYDGWGSPGDDELRGQVERENQAIDDKLGALAKEAAKQDAESPVVATDVLPPGWQAGEADERSERDKSEGKQEDRFRHVHYNFASDLDSTVRRRIIGILDRAEHRRVNIFGSEAFRTCETALVKGRFVKQGTNAWVLRLDQQARLEIAREAATEGFKLVSFDDTSLSFIYRPVVAWKPILSGVAMGSAILMGAGIFTGYLIWGRNNPRPRPRSTNRVN